MHNISIPGLGFQPSVISLGVVGFGSATSRDESFRMLDRYVEAGGNFADTAHVYASWLPNGEGKSERTLGEWLRSRQSQNFYIATKGGHPPLSDMEQTRMKPEDLAQDIAESFERLQSDHVDLYWLHRDDEKVPVGEIIDALNQQNTNGRLGAFGASNWSTKRIAAANDYARQHGLQGFAASQIGWSIAEVNPAVRGAAKTVQMDGSTLQWHHSTNFPQIAYSSQANGFFSYPLEALRNPSSDKEHALAKSYFNEQNAARYERAAQLGQKLGRDAAQVALAYIWSQSFPAVAIIGPRTAQQLEDSLRAADLQLSAEDIAFLENSK
jgi:aryl-alcohol dehydrogenase-like predicted oxidoreductase